MGDMSDTLDNIKMLQDKESRLYSSLGVSIDGQPVDTAGQQKILDEINSMTGLRVNLIRELKNQYTSLHVNVSESNDDIKDEVASIELMEQQLNEKKEQLSKLKSIEKNKLRMADINNYYSERASFVSTIYYTILLVVVSICVVLIGKRYIPIIPSVAVNGIVSLIILWGIFSVVYKILDLYSRDKMNFDQYDYSRFNPKQTTPTVFGYDAAQLSKFRDVLVSKEQAIYNIDTATPATSKESFTSTIGSYMPYDPMGNNDYALNLLQ